jgi:hypothetical protein
VSFRLAFTGLGFQVVGTAFLLLDSLRTGSRLPQTGLKLSDTGIMACPLVQWASVVGFALLLVGFILEGIALWKSRGKSH